LRYIYVYIYIDIVPSLISSLPPSRRQLQFCLWIQTKLYSNEATNAVRKYIHGNEQEECVDMVMHKDSYGNLARFKLVKIKWSGGISRAFKKNCRDLISWTDR